MAGSSGCLEGRQGDQFSTRVSLKQSSSLQVSFLCLSPLSLLRYAGLQGSGVSLSPCPHPEEAGLRFLHAGRERLVLSHRVQEVSLLFNPRVCHSLPARTVCTFTANGCSWQGYWIKKTNVESLLIIGDKILRVALLEIRYLRCFIRVAPVYKNAVKPTLLTRRTMTTKPSCTAEKGPLFYLATEHARSSCQLTFRESPWARTVSRERGPQP